MIDKAPTRHPIARKRSSCRAEFVWFAVSPSCPEADPPADMATQAGEPRLAVAEAARAPSQIEQRWARLTVTRAAALVVRQQCPDEGVG